MLDSLRHSSLVVGRVRLLAFGVIVLVVIPMAMASRLEPNPTGLGTHQQLGLPPCSFRVLLGIRCPSCGMTTSWAWFTRGGWIESMRASLGGFLLAFTCVGAVLTAIHSAWRNQPPGPRTTKAFGIATVVIGVTSLTQWLWLLARP